MTPADLDPFERRLAPDLFDRRFDDLVELGRSRLPSLAPDWTDHNLHDPGITLMELLAWVAEAQLYSLARMRRDERTAYAALLGLQPAGPQPASGLIWPAAPAPGTAFSQSLVIGEDAEVRVADSDTPTFRPQQRTLCIAGGIRALRARLAGGRLLDHTRTNERGGPAFLPFGELAGPGDALALEFECAGKTGLFPPRRADAEGACMIVGVRADASAGADAPGGDAPLAVTLVADGARTALKIVADTTQGFMRTGTCVLDVSAVAGSPQSFTLEFRSPRGFARPPRVLRIALNVLPVVQGAAVAREVHVANGLPDQSLELDSPGLRFGAGAAPLKVEINDPDPFTVWEARRSLAECGPADRAYELDPAAGRVTFGNGLNGAIPAEGAQIFFSYPVCDGAAGNVARNQKWTVRGVSGVFGLNPDPIGGGTDAGGLPEQRREARRRARQDHALVTAGDIEAAALMLPALELARAWVCPPQAGAIDRAGMTLVAMRARPGGVEPEQTLETPRWLAAIRRRLAGRMPLGTRLVVAAPAYIGFRIQAKLEAEESLDPQVVSDAVRGALRKRLALVDAGDGGAPRAFGVAVSRRDLVAWMLAVPGVRRIAALRVMVTAGQAVDEVAVPRRGLPRIDLAQSTFEVVRAAPGGTP
ncbi:MAG TPA: putative baseplate assembly protein [Burkholderiales bacterium]|nr:putative baseplate assembly protein [Burkholderiales bacterium]